MNRKRIELLRGLVRGMSVDALVHLGSNRDAASVAAFEKAMAPLHAYRASSGATGKEARPDGDDPEPVESTEPIPPLPAPFVTA